MYIFEGEGGEGSKKVYILYIHLNVDNYERFLRSSVELLFVAK